MPFVANNPIINVLTSGNRGSRDFLRGAGAKNQPGEGGSPGWLKFRRTGIYAFQIMSATVRFAGTNGSTCSV